MPYLLDVKTVTGVAYRGRFHDIADVAELEAFAAQAYREGHPLLLKIELWSRERPLNSKAALLHQSTAFFKLEPQRTGAPQPYPVPGELLVQERSRSPIRVAAQRDSSYAALADSHPEPAGKRLHFQTR